MPEFKTLLNCEHVTKELNRCYSFYFSLLRTRGQHLNYNIFWKSLTWTCDKKKLGLVSKLYFIWTMFLMLYYNYPSFFVWMLLLFLEISGNMCILIILFPFYDVINSKLPLAFLWKRFSSWHKKSWQKL